MEVGVTHFILLILTAIESEFYTWMMKVTKRMYCSSKPRSLISIAILVIFILQTNLLKAHAHAIFEINNVSSSDGYVVLHLYENKTSFKKFNPDRIYKKVATKGKTIIPINDYHEGDIAIFVFHDENSDEEFNTSIFWTPKKGLRLQ